MKECWRPKINHLKKWSNTIIKGFGLKEEKVQSKTEPFTKREDDKLSSPDKTDYEFYLSEQSQLRIFY